MGVVLEKRGVVKEIAASGVVSATQPAGDRPEPSVRPAKPMPLVVVSMPDTESAIMSAPSPLAPKLVQDGGSSAPRPLLDELRLNCLDSVLASRHSSECLAAAFVMSVAVRLGLRRTRLVHRRDEQRRDRFSVLVDGPLVSDGRDSVRGPLVLDIHRRTVIRCAEQGVGIDNQADRVRDLPFSVAAADRRAAVALLRRMRREQRALMAEMTEADQTAGHQRLATAAGESRDDGVLWLREATTLPEIPVPNGHQSTPLLGRDAFVPMAQSVVVADQDQEPGEHADREEYHPNYDDDYNNGDPLDTQAVQPSNVVTWTARTGATADGIDGPAPKADMATLGTLMPPKVLGAYLCNHLMVVGAGQSMAQAATKASAGSEPASVRVPVATLRRDTTEMSLVRTPNPVILSDDATWRLLRSQIVFLAQLP